MRSFLLTLAAAALLFPLTANATDVEGDVWGTWTRENSPYNVIGEVRVPAGSTLVIEPGVLVDFKGHYKFIVDSLATLLAVGTETDSIFFTAEDTATGWHGIRFMYSDSSSQISYCRLEHGKATGDYPDNCGGAVYCHSCSPIISRSSITGNAAGWCGGGLWFRFSRAVVSNNRIHSNKTTDEGAGGIYCSYSELTVRGNSITENSAHGNGGGIYCVNCEPTICDNIISGNFTPQDGGGIYCNHSSPTISANLITANTAYRYGGGISCQSLCNPLVTDNAISGNHALQNGGGISCFDSSCPLIAGNTVSGNSTTRRGGGISCCESSTPTMTSNTIAGNSAPGYWGRGGGIYLYLSEPDIVNTILWGNVSPNGAQVYADNCDPRLWYCDVEGGWPGAGNIDDDPLFVGADEQDLHLRWRSPCIDTGNLHLKDPDGTCSDIGAFYFDQNVDAVVELYPHKTPIIIQPEGGEVMFDRWLFNFSGQRLKVDIWTYLFSSELGRYGPIQLYQGVRIPVDSLGTNEFVQRVPQVAPEGGYVFVVYLGQYPSAIVDSSYFYFTKEGEVVGVPDDWTEDGLPTQYALFQNYPNPFNSATRISYQLPPSSNVKLEVFDVLGRKVARLMDSRQQAGYRSVVWDASGLSSGLYFYKLTAGEFSQTRRMILVK